MVFGSGNNWRYIDVSKIATLLEEKQPGITEELIGIHTLTGCDFTSCFSRKGKVEPFQKMEKIATHINALQSLSNEEVY